MLKCNPRTYDGYLDLSIFLFLPDITPLDSATISNKANEMLAQV